MLWGPLLQQKVHHRSMDCSYGDRRIYAVYIYIYIYGMFLLFLKYLFIFFQIFYVHPNISGKVGSAHQRYRSSASVFVRYSGEKDFQSATKRHDKDNWTRENICRSLTARLQAVRDDAPGSSKKKTKTPRRLSLCYLTAAIFFSLHHKLGGGIFTLKGKYSRFYLCSESMPGK